MADIIPPFTLRFYGSVTSTNEIARDLITEDGCDGTVVVADHQTEGRGRRGRVWSSPLSMGLWATLILYSPLEARELFTLGLTAAVALSKAIESGYGAAPEIQWPNDIYVNGRKLGGILVEIVNSGDGIDYALLGMGVNLGQKRCDFPEEIRETAISLSEVVGKSVERMEFIGRLLTALRGEIRALYDDGFEGIRGDYRDRSNLLRRRVTIVLDNGTVEGEVVDFGPHGELMLSIEGGPVRSLVHGEVHKVWR